MIIAACSPAEATPSATEVPTPVPAGPTPAPATPTPVKLTGTLTIGSNHSALNEQTGMSFVNDAFKKATGLTVTMNTVDQDTFYDQISSYLGGTPADALTWLSGYRMQYFAAKGLITAIDDVWAKVSKDYTAGFANAVTGADKKIYGIPTAYYPWCVFYRKSVWSDKGYTVPATWDDLIALCKKMQTDGLTPIAFADKQGFPAMGTFDILNLRLNGYQFHVDLLSGKEKWTDARVTAVFNQWAKLIPFYTHGFSGLNWEDATDTLVRKQSGMYLIGLFVTDEVLNVDKAAVDDLDFFTFPFMGNDFDAEKALDAPLDIWMISAKSPSLAANLANAKAYLEFWAKASTQQIFFIAQPGKLPTSSEADPSSYTALQKKAVQIVSTAQKITHFLDRDTRPEFVGTNGMPSFLLSFLKNPSQNLTQLQASIQAFWDKLPVES
jgi:multiple sugar transport system substrate-binding protein